MHIKAIEGGFSTHNYENYSLIGLLKEASPTFKKFFAQRILNLSKDDPYRSLLNTNTPKEWFGK